MTPAETILKMIEEVDYEGDPANGFVYLTQGGKNIACLYGTTAQKIERAKMIVDALKSSPVDVDIEELKIKLEDQEPWRDGEPITGMAREQRGWNDCLDHLTQNGYRITKESNNERYKT